MYLKTPPINLCAFSLSRMLSFYHLSCLIKRHSIHCLRSVPSPPLLCTPTPPLASAHPTYWAALRRLAGSPSAPRPGDRIPMSPHTRSVRPLTPIFFLLPQWLQTYQLARTPLYKTSSRWRPHQPRQLLPLRGPWASSLRRNGILYSRSCRIRSSLPSSEEEFGTASA